MAVSSHVGHSDGKTYFQWLNQDFMHNIYCLKKRKVLKCKQEEQLESINHALDKE